MSRSFPFDFHTPWYLASHSLQSPSSSDNPGPALLTPTDTVGEHLLRMIKNFRDTGQSGSGLPAGATSSTQVLLDPSSPIAGDLTQSGSPSNVQSALDSLYRQLNYQPPTVSCSLAPASLFELGNVPQSLTLSWHTSSSDPLVSIVVRAGSSPLGAPAITDTSIQVSPVPTQDTSFTVEVSDGTSLAKSSCSLRYLPRSYWGSLPVTPQGGNIPAGLSSELRSSASGSYQFNSPQGYYSYFIFPDSICSSQFLQNPQCKVNGFDTQLVTVSKSVPIPNQFGQSPICSVYRLSQPGLGQFTAVIL